MSTPIVGRNAVVKKDNEDIGYATGVRATIDVDLVKAYKIGSDKPVVLESGNKTFRITIDKMYIDNAFAQDVISGSKVSIVIQPAG
ncbi:MAG: hypothetical protein QXF26_09440, partial [Candidatus Bathyarchaeia archaeon]